jgi:hypothetical protein
VTASPIKLRKRLPEKLRRKSSGQPGWPKRLTRQSGRDTEADRTTREHQRMKMRMVAPCRKGMTLE